MSDSKLSTFVIDCKTEDLAAAASFWAAALRRELEPAVPGYERYRMLACAPAEPVLMLQKVEHDSRIHLDIESDDIEAEVARLEGLGARRIEAVRSWVVMEAPTGHRFCVVRPQRPKHAPPAFEATPGHALLAGFVGRYQGTTRTFLGPGEPVVDEDTLEVESILGGRFVRLQWFGSVGQAPRQGEMLLGWHRDAGAWELSWIDTFHTGTQIMAFTGAAEPDADRVRVLGSYAAGDERWGFGIELRREGDTLMLRATNITPAGEVYRAIETDFQPRPRS